MYVFNTFELMAFIGNSGIYMGIMCGIINIMCYFNDLRHDVGGPAREISRGRPGGLWSDPDSHMELKGFAQIHMGIVTGTFWRV